MTEPFSAPAVPVSLSLSDAEVAARPSIAATTWAWLRDLLLALLIAVLLVLFLYRPVKVDGTSMLPTLQNGSRLFIDQFSYRLGLSHIKRGDTVVFWFPDDTTKSYIKRVIGLPGDKLRIQDGYVILNGKKLYEAYVPGRYRDHDNYRSITVPRNDYFVLGDHRNASNDSRAWGFVPRSYIYGKAVFVFWPLREVGTIN
jgi:signal peptidase I